MLSQTSKWMSPLEQEYVVAHLHRNAPKKTSKTWDTPEIVAMFADPTFWLFSLFWACEFGLSHSPRRNQIPADRNAAFQATPSERGVSRQFSLSW